MKWLISFLSGIYVVVIILLLLNLNMCQDSPRQVPTEGITDTQTPPETITPETVDIRDTVDVHGHTGELRVTLLWDFPGDIDIHVKTPKNTEIWYRNRKDRTTGGEQDRDNRQGGPGSHENVYWSDPPAGTYKVYVNYYQPTSTRSSGDATIEVTYKGVKHTYKQFMDVNDLRHKYPVTEINVE